MADKFGTSVNRPNAGGFKAPPMGYLKQDTGKPGGTPTGSVPGLGGRMEGMHVGPIKGSGKTVSPQRGPGRSGSAGC